MVKEKMNKQQLYERMNDLKRYSFVLLALSSFLYLGLVLPENNVIQTDQHQIVTTIVSLIFIGSSLLCLKRSFYYRKLIQEEDN
ncbi:YrhC family protein [Bacillus carboniphilus]|uniref:YrhC family protein n=1 Tax=Bacillus carboniphilus TaxID=86663 RepID=A0ABY9JXB2_9BACI|nr:YrhC family protein [Bacillus carboniphilus]WLR44019.1 YrhC family protein [Bacillus carboniphilus]